MSVHEDRRYRSAVIDDDIHLTRQLLARVDDLACPTHEALGHEGRNHVSHRELPNLTLYPVMGDSVGELVGDPLRRGDLFDDMVEMFGAHDRP